MMRRQYSRFPGLDHGPRFRFGPEPNREPTFAWFAPSGSRWLSRS